ncbi:hypothetical protein ACKI2N_033175 [Cupriavidus sp. 30B13]
MTRPLLVVAMILSALAYELRASAACRWGPSNPPAVRLAGTSRRKTVSR